MKLRKPRILGDRILVKVKKDLIDKDYQFNSKTGKYDEVSETGFVIQSLTKDQIENLKLGTQEARVVQIGKDAYKSLGSGDNWVEIGDLVTICRWSGEALPDIGDGEIYRVISDHDVYVHWEDE